MSEVKHKSVLRNDFFFGYSPDGKMLEEGRWKRRDEENKRSESLNEFEFLTSHLI